MIRSVACFGIASAGLIRGVPASYTNKISEVGLRALRVRHFCSERGSHPSNKTALEELLNKKILNEPVLWRKEGLFALKTDLGNGITALVFPGAEDMNTAISVTDGQTTVHREIDAYWLENWSVAKEDQTSNKAALEELLDKKVLNDPIVWHNDGMVRVKADLGNGITAYVYMSGFEDESTMIEVTDGQTTVHREISAQWLENWTLSK